MKHWRALAVAASLLSAAFGPAEAGPLPASPSWTAEGNQAGASFGFATATAGDVNGDGYTDVIAGANTHDNGQADEGRAYLYLGSASGPGASPAWTAESDQAGALFGYAVAPAGDVNGDGYADVIVGAYLYDNGEADEGRAYVYFGSASGLGATPAWTSEGNQAGAYFGFSVAPAGDVNDDGFADVIVGAQRYSNGEASEGRAFVYLGSASGLAATPAWTAESNQAAAYFGTSVATAGDVNADGYADVIVGAHRYANGQSLEGRAFLYLGSGSGPAAAPSWTQEINQATAFFGRSVATAGDVNGDGYSDVVVSAFFFDNGEIDEGRAFVYHGSASGLGTAPAWTAEGDQASARFGAWVATAGDVNGDGYADVMVGATSFDNGQTDEGRAFVYMGSASGLAATAVWTAEADQDAAAFGASVGAAGDVDGDGFGDVLVGASYFDNGEADEGRAFLYRGSAAALAATPAWGRSPAQANAYLGVTATAAGDVNGDGYADVITGAYGYDNGETDEGQAFVYAGSTGGLTWQEEGDQPGAFFGSAVAGAGDVNGDGYSDVIVGAYGYDNDQANEGRAYLYLGAISGLASIPVWTAEGNQAGAAFGGSVASAGDVNGDGYGDILVGAALYDNGETDEGRAFLYLGSPTGPSATPTWTAESNQAGGRLGTVATAGDVNRDGRSDVIVGAEEYDNGQTNEGRAFAWYGEPSGLGPDGTPANADWTAEGDQAGAFFGVSVSTAGDVNGDGFSDVIVGAPLYDVLGSFDAGRVFVYHGSPAGLSATPNWFNSFADAGDRFGFSASTAGDVNGDGFSDVIVGAYLAESGAETDEGRAYLYLGSPTGIAVAPPTWGAEPNQANASFGRSVSPAGDVNADGYADVVVGAHLYDDTLADEGRVFVYLGNEKLGVQGREALRCRQRRLSGRPLDLLGGADENAFRLAARGWTPAGRARVRLEWNVAELPAPFGGGPPAHGCWFATGDPFFGRSEVSLDEVVQGLIPDAPHRWRIRVAGDSPYFPHSPWLTLAPSVPSLEQLRTGGAAPPPPDANWWDGFDALGMDGAVSALMVYDGELVAGGEFTQAGGTAASHIARWDGSAWSPLGPGTNAPVRCLAVYGGELVAGGEFTLAGGAAASYIAKWNGSAWSPLGPGMDGAVRALALHAGNLVAGGSFTQAGGSPAARIATWNGTAWSAVGSGMNGDVLALTVFEGELIAGGEFMQAGGTAASRIARWNGSAWSAFGSGANNGANGAVFSLAVTSRLWAGGAFTRIAGVTANRVAVWDGSWTAMGPGVCEEAAGSVRAILVHNGKLTVAGAFDHAGGFPAENIAAWDIDQHSWSTLASGLGGGTGQAAALAVYQGSLYAGGSFMAAGGHSSRRIARWTDPLAFDAAGITLESWLAPHELAPGAQRANDVWGYVAPSGREYAMIGLTNGAAFVEVTDPANPVHLATIPHTFSWWTDMRPHGQYAYIVADATTGGMQIVDLTQIDSGAVSYLGAFTGGGLERAHTMGVNPESGYVYLFGSNLGAGGITAVDVSNPTSPAIAGSWDGHYVHDGQVVSYASGPYAGREIAFAATTDSGLTVVDVTNKAAMFQVSRVLYPRVSYCHQGWLSEDRRYFFIDDEFDEQAYGGPSTTYVVDVSDIEHPQYVTAFTNGLRSVDHDLMVRGDRVYEANYSSGLRIYDVSDLASVQEVAHFDTHPENDDPNYDGAWGVYAGFPSGIVVVSDRERGLFVLRVTGGNGVAAGAPPGPVLALHANYPNPFNPRTTIRFELPGEGRVELAVFNPQGRRVRTLVEGRLEAGPHAVTWDGRTDRGAEVASGVYFYRLESPGVSRVRKMALVR